MSFAQPICGNTASVAARREVRPALRTAFTLLEVILALALFVVIMGAVAAAIRLYYVNLTQSQRTLELTALARGTVNLVANDLRSAIQFKPVDVSGLNELIASNAASMLGAGGGSGGEAGTGGNGSGGTGSGTGDDNGSDAPDEGNAGGGSGTEDGAPTNGGSGGQAGGQASGGQTGSSGTGSTAAAGATESDEPPIDRPMLIGSSNQLVVDISRLPRIDQYHPILHTSEVGSYLTLPTDIKSVSYFVSFDTAGGKFNGGLFRREVDRTSLRQAGVATAFEVDAAAREIAPEVVEIAFRYFDGETWQSEWDSDSQGGFPAAIEFVMIMDPRRLRGGAEQSYEYRGFNAETMRVFRCVTHLPIAEMLSEEQQELAQDRSGGLNTAQEDAPADDGGGNQQPSGDSGGQDSGGDNTGGNGNDGQNSGGQNGNPGGGPPQTGGQGPGRGNDGPGGGRNSGAGGQGADGPGTRGPGTRGPGAGGGRGGGTGPGNTGGNPGSGRGSPSGTGRGSGNSANRGGTS